MTDEKLVTVAGKVPATLRDKFAALAKLRQLTPSLLLRHLIERELAGAPDDVTGEVESAVRAELTERGHDLGSARAAAALNLARRMDRDPSAGAANAAQLRLLLVDLVPIEQAERFEFTPLDGIRALARLKQAGFVVVPQSRGLETDYDLLRESDWSQRQLYRFEQDRPTRESKNSGGRA